MVQIQDLQKKVNSLSDAREFYDPESRSSSGATHVPDQTSTILSSRTLPRCDSGWETFLNDHLLNKDNLQQFKEFGIFISRNEICFFRDSKERYERGIIEHADSTISLPK